MTATIESATRVGDVVSVVASSDLPAVIAWHWYLDGAWVGSSAGGSRSFQLPPGDQARLDVLDTDDPDFDPIASAPAGWPARRTLWWTRSPDLDVARYVVEEQRDGGAWAQVGVVLQLDDAWSMSWTTARLVDLADYAWRVTPYDAIGNAGTAIALDAERIVRRPDAPAFSVELDPDAQTITWEAA